MNFNDASTVLRYEKTDGKLYWVERFPNVGPNKTFNTKYANKEAGHVMSHGYRVVAIKGRTFMVHRVIWLLHHRSWPSDELDHINGEIHDNKIENLRIASRSENNRNKGRPKNNTSGYKGVSKDRNKWRAQITDNGKVIHLGNYTTALEAKNAYQIAAKKLHGKFYNNDNKKEG